MKIITINLICITLIIISIAGVFIKRDVVPVEQYNYHIEEGWLLNQSNDTIFIKDGRIINQWKTKFLWNPKN